MTSELKAKIAADIQRSGFGSEMRVLKQLQEAEWNATGLAYYVDLDTSATRESDIKAHSVIGESRDDDRTIDFQVFHGLSIEVKKTEKPWVVFKEAPRTKMDFNEGRKGLLFSDGLTKSHNFLVSKPLRELSLINKMGWFGNGVHEAFKNPDQPSRWYSSFVSVCKAAEHQLSENSWKKSENDSADQYPYVWFVKPLIVIDGQLFSAELNAQAELEIVEEKMCSVKFEFASPHYKRRQYFVDLVTIDGLQAYLSICKTRISELAKVLRKIALTSG